MQVEMGSQPAIWGNEPIGAVKNGIFAFIVDY